MPLDYRRSCLLSTGKTVNNTNSQTCMLGYMSTIGERIRIAREALGMSQEELATRVGIKQQSVGDLENGKTRSTKHLLKFARVLGRNPDWLETGDVSKSGATTEVEPATVAGQPMSAPSIASMQIDVPELGTAVGGNHGDFSLNGQVIDYKRRPPGIASNRGVFCIRVRGESMAPRFEEGDLIFVDPNRPTKGGDDVLVEMKPQRAGEPGNAYIKRLVSKTPTKLILRQFNPADAKVELQAEKVLRVSYILTLADLVGV
jgi:phage repressor protein C with HTH and peptisase S24 domain